MAIKFQFNEKKAVQAAAYLIQKNGGSMNYMALLKLLFLADRASLLKRGHPITGDQIFSMKHGLVLTQILDRISQKKQEHRAQLWHEFIPRPSPAIFLVHVEKEPGTDLLAPADLSVLDEVMTKFAGLDEWELVDVVHELPEWRETNSALPVPFEDILRSEEVSEEVIERIEDESEAARLLAA